MPSLDLGSVVGPQGEQGATGAQGIRGEQGLPGPNQVTNSTATPLTGVLTGNGSVVGVASIDAAPTADSTGFAQSGGTDKAIKGRVPVYGRGVNLLRNWYFVGGGTGRGVSPVNQRGQSSYTGVSYSIDGWYVRNASALVELTSSGLKLKKNTVNYADFGQYLSQETLNILSGKTVTLSWLDDVDCKSVSFTWAASSTPLVYSADNLNIYAGGNSPNAYNCLFQTTTTEKAFKAVKLELGSEQTLCHNEGTAEAPVWVLNEIPDYEYELYRCMTSTADSSDTYANKTFATEQELAYVENGTTATKTNGYAVGEYFCWHGSLYRAKTAIGNGDTFTENTNCEQVTGGGLNELKATLFLPGKLTSRASTQLVVDKVSTPDNIAANTMRSYTVQQSGFYALFGNTTSNSGICVALALNSDASTSYDFYSTRTSAIQQVLTGVHYFEAGETIHYIVQIETNATGSALLLRYY